MIIISKKSKPHSLEGKKKRRKPKDEYIDYPEQDDTFYFIAGYTSGGLPYGVTWEEMCLEPWQDIDSESDSNSDIDEVDLPF